MKRYLLIPATAVIFTAGCGVSETTDTVEKQNQETIEQVVEPATPEQNVDQSAEQTVEQQEEVLKGLVASYVAFENSGEYSNIKGLAYPKSVVFDTWASAVDVSDVLAKKAVLNIEVLAIEGETAYVFTEEEQTPVNPTDVDLDMQYESYYEMKKSGGEWLISIIAPDLESEVNKDINKVKEHLQQQADFLTQLD